MGDCKATAKYDSEAGAFTFSLNGEGNAIIVHEEELGLFSAMLQAAKDMDFCCDVWSLVLVSEEKQLEIIDHSNGDSK